MGVVFHPAVIDQLLEFQPIRIIPVVRIPDEQNGNLRFPSQSGQWNGIFPTGYGSHAHEVRICPVTCSCAKKCLGQTEGNHGNLFGRDAKRHPQNLFLRFQSNDVVRTISERLPGELILDGLAEWKA